jgi:hypothetical protein
MRQSFNPLKQSYGDFFFSFNFYFSLTSLFFSSSEKKTVFKQIKDINLI